MTTVDFNGMVGPPRRLTEILIQQARNIQMLPDVAVQAIRIADDPDAKVKDLVRVIAQHVKLTTNLVTLSNSTLFGVTQSVAGLEQAITRVGFRQTKNMIMAASITAMMAEMDWHELRVRDLLCKHSFLTGVICSRLNTLFKLGLQGEEFTAGLVHDIGRTLLAVSIPEEFDALDPLDFAEESQISRELDSIGTTHAEVGAWFLQRNHVPEELVTVARYHHNPEESDKFKKLVALTALADDMANFCQGGGVTDDYEFENNTNLQLLETLGAESPAEKLEEFSGIILSSSLSEMRQLTSF